MSAPLTVDRATAARINPIISELSPKDTLATCAELVRAIGYATSTADEAVCTQMFRLANVVAAAVEFELDGICWNKIREGEL